jgi:hypothetical protein
LHIFKKRSTIVLASIGAIGAIAAIATAASFALFYDPVSPQAVTFAAGNVTLEHVVSANCKFTGIAPGFSTYGYPGTLGDQSKSACTVDIKYTGSLDAFLALDISVKTSAGNSTLACNGGDAGGSASCVPLYNPSATPLGSDDGLEIYVLANGDSNLTLNGAQNGPTQAFGIGSDQTLTQPGTHGVDTSYTGSYATPPGVPAGSSQADCTTATGVDCPVAGGSNYLESYSVYAYWPMDDNGDQNNYQNSSATVTLTEHAVQASDNPLFSCPAVNDSQGLFGAASYQTPDQPDAGWGGGFSAGSTTYPAIGVCPGIDGTTTGTDWTSSTQGTELLPFYHPDN